MGGGKALFFPIVILAMAFLAFGGVKWYLYYLNKENNKLYEESSLQLSGLSGKNSDRIADFQNRMDVASKETTSRSNYEDYFKELESSIVSGVKVVSFGYSQDTIEITMSADSFETVAKQMLSFNKSKYFSGLTIDKTTSKDKDGKITFSMRK